MPESLPSFLITDLKMPRIQNIKISLITSQNYFKIKFIYPCVLSIDLFKKKNKKLRVVDKHNFNFLLFIFLEQ